MLQQVGQKIDVPILRGDALVEALPGEVSGIAIHIGDRQRQDGIPSRQ